MADHNNYDASSEQKHQLIGLGDTNRLDPSFYTESVDFDFFDEAPPSQNMIPTSSQTTQDSSSSVTGIPASSSSSWISTAAFSSNATERAVSSSPWTSTGSSGSTSTPVITTNFHPDTNSLLQLHIAPEYTPNTASVLLHGNTNTSITDSACFNATEQDYDREVPFSTQLLMAALQPDQLKQSVVDCNGSVSVGTRFRLFDLTDSEDEGEEEHCCEEDAELAEINRNRNKATTEASRASIFRHVQVNDRIDSAAAQSSPEAEHRNNDGKLKGSSISGRRSGTESGGRRSRNISGRRSKIGSRSSSDSSMDSGDDEGYYLTDSDISDMTDVTPMSSLAASPMPPPISNTFGGRASGTPFRYEESTEEDEEGASHLYDGYLINNLQDSPGGGRGGATRPRSCANRARSNNKHGDLDVDEDDEDIEQLLKMLPSQIHDNSNCNNGSNKGSGLNDCPTASNVGIPALIVSPSRNAKTVKGSATALGENGRKKVHQSPFHLRLNRVHHGGGNAGWHQHQHHHVGHSHHHGYHNNYHQQYHNLTLALQRKRQNQQKQIQYENNILKRKIQTVKPSLEIKQAFNNKMSSVAGNLNLATSTGNKKPQTSPAAGSSSSSVSARGKY